MKKDPLKQKRLFKKVMGPDFDFNKIKFISTEDDKISEALLAYAKPLLEECDSYYHCENAIGFATTIWNLCLLPENEREACYKAFLETIAGDDLSDRVLYAKLIKTFIARKEEMFPGDKRFIVNYKLTDKGNKIDLVVAAILLEEKEE
ncbi:MAG: hypothetical protein K6U03_09420 [Firmicutes bacterium]|nr:hypothetical protein [Bacillota bacterium]